MVMTEEFQRLVIFELGTSQSESSTVTARPYQGSYPLQIQSYGFEFQSFPTKVNIAVVFMWYDSIMERRNDWISCYAFLNVFFTSDHHNSICRFFVLL